jgi:hypothetical protein
MNANNITFFIVIIFTLKFRLLLFKVYVQLIQTYEISYLPITSLCIESCGFVNEEFPTEIQKFAKEQQVLVYAKYSNLPYTVLGKVFIQLF